MDVGLELRQARERRGLSLQRLSFITKISPRVLQAIETCDERQLPAWVFTRSFVKSFATEVGLDPHDTLRRYLDQCQPPAPAEVETVEPAGVAAPPRLAEPEPSAPGARILHGRFGTATTVALVTIGGLALLAGRLSRHHAAEVPPATVVATAGLVPGAAPPSPVGTSGTSAAPGELHIAISPTGPCWVQASVGDDRVIRALLAAGDTRTLDAASGVILRIGDPSTFAFAINGRAARVAGQPGEPVTVRITRQNYTRYLSH
jgi:hypothetical protein